MSNKIEDLENRLENIEIEIYDLRNPDRSGAAGLFLMYIILIILIFVK